MSEGFEAVIQIMRVCDQPPTTWLSIAALGSVVGLLGLALVPLSGYNRTELLVEWCYYRSGYKRFVEVYNGYRADRSDRGFNSLMHLLDEYGNLAELNRDREDTERIRIGHPANDVFVVFYSENSSGDREHESIPGLEETRREIVRKARPKIDTTLTWIGRTGWILRFIAAVLGLLYLIRPSVVGSVNIGGCRIVLVASFMW